MSINNLVQKVAEAICPSWWGELHMRDWDGSGVEVETHLLDNYQGQHKHYRAQSLEEAETSTRIVLDEVAKWMKMNDFALAQTGYGGQYFPTGRTIKDFARENGIEL